MFQQIDRVTFLDIIEEIKRRLAVIGVYNFYEILAVDPDTTPEQTMKYLIEQAVSHFNKYIPLLYIQKIYIRDTDYPIFTFVDNFHLYLNGTLQPDAVNLIPDSVIALSTVPVFHAKYNAFPFTYQPPHLYLKVRVTGRIYAKTLCKYKVHVDPNNYANNAIYFLTKGSQMYYLLINQIVYNVGYHIIMLKKNYAISELPIEVFNGIEEYISELKSELDNLYNEGLRNYLILY